MTIETEKPWKELTKQERGERIKAGKQKKAAAQPASQNDMAATIAVEVAKALAGIQQSVQKVVDPKDMSPEELKKEHERLQKALEALPFVGDQVTGALEPGTIIGEGLTREYVPLSKEWFLDVEARRKDRNKHNGKPAELTWPEYGLHDVLYQGNKPLEEICIGGVCFGLIPGQMCKLPTPFYGKYMDRFKHMKQFNDTFAEPDHPGTKSGYVHAKVSANGKMLAVLLGQGPLPGQAEREANDVKP